MFFYVGLIFFVLFHVVIIKSLRCVLPSDVDSTNMDSEITKCSIMIH
jgi:hypothetical protein